jgi:hypothetical protein
MEVYHPNDKEIVLCRGALTRFFNREGKEIGQSAYREALANKVTDIRRHQYTAVICRHKGEPNKLFVKAFCKTHHHVTTKKGAYQSLRNRSIITYSYHMDSFHLYERTYTTRKRKKFVTLRTNKTGSTHTATDIIENAFGGAECSIKNFYTTWVKELGLNYIHHLGLRTKTLLDAVQAVNIQFLLEKRGFDIPDFLANQPKNFPPLKFPLYLKHISPGNNMNDLLLRLTNSTEENVVVLRNNPMFDTLYSEENLKAFNQIKRYYNVEPNSFLQMEWLDNNQWVSYVPLLKEMANTGYSFDQLANLTITELREVAYAAHYFRKLGLKMNVEAFINISRVKADYNILRSVIDDFLSQNSVVIPKNKSFERKLNAGGKFRFSPVHYYTNTLKRCDSYLQMPYAVHHQDYGVFGLVLFSDFDTPRIKKMKSNDVRYQLENYLHHKHFYTKLNEVFDFTIKYNKQELERLIKTKLTERQIGLVLWDKNSKL